MTIILDISRPANLPSNGLWASDEWINFHKNNIDRYSFIDEWFEEHFKNRIKYDLENEVLIFDSEETKAEFLLKYW